MIKIKDREITLACGYFYQVCYGEYADIVKKYRQSGDFCPPWHWFIDKEGEAHKGRDIGVVAGSQYPNNEEIVAIAIDSPDDISLSPAQADTVADVTATVFALYPDIERININVSSYQVASTMP